MLTRILRNHTRLLFNPNRRIQTTLMCFINRSAESISDIKPKDNKNVDDLNDFTPIYKFSHIRSVAIINKLKRFQSYLTIIGIPTALVLNQLNFLHTDGVIITCVLGLSGCMTLYTLGYFTDNLIGFLYLDKTNERLRVAYIDFWGRRRDEIVDIHDIIPLSDMPSSITDSLYLKLSRYSKNGFWKLNLRFGEILDSDKYNTIFKTAHIR